MFYALQGVRIFSCVQVCGGVLSGLLGGVGVPGGIGVIAFGFGLVGKGEWMFMCIVSFFLCGRKGQPSGK